MRCILHLIQSSIDYNSQAVYLIQLWAMQLNQVNCLRVVIDARLQLSGSLPDSIVGDAIKREWQVGYDLLHQKLYESACFLHHKNLLLFQEYAYV